MWRDEAQKWLISEHMSFSNFISITRYEGHPFLFYAILSIFSKLGLPYFTVKLVTLSLAILAAYILLFVIEINTTLKCAFLIFGMNFKKSIF